MQHLKTMGYLNFSSCCLFLHICETAKCLKYLSFDPQLNLLSREKCQILTILSIPKHVDFEKKNEIYGQDKFCLQVLGKHQSGSNYLAHVLVLRFLKISSIFYDNLVFLDSNFIPSRFDEITPFWRQIFCPAETPSTF